MPYVINEGDGTSFFERAQLSPPDQDGLISSQLDPSLPAVRGLSRVTDPLIPVQHASVRFRNFDSDLYDLSPSSHLSKLLKALTGAAGAGGIRKKTTVSRISSGLHGAHFLDLDSFYGALFNLVRNVNEQMPTGQTGIEFNPLTDVTNADGWDDLAARDAQYRSRIIQFARAVNMGCTYPGLVGIAEAVINAEVDIYESWVEADNQHSQQLVVASTALSWVGVKAQFGTWGKLNGATFALLEGNRADAGVTPDGNRGELVISARRQLTEDERFQLGSVLRILKPSHTQVTVNDTNNQIYEKLRPRTVSADSENWTVVSTVSPNASLPQFVSDAIYPAGAGTSSLRPAFSQIYGETWSYSPNVRNVTSYQMNGNYESSDANDEEVITYQDGEVHTFSATDAVLDSRRVVTARLASDGIIAAYPYSPNRIVTLR